jgi:competence protein ComEA
MTKSISKMVWAALVALTLGVGAGMVAPARAQADVAREVVEPDGPTGVVNLNTANEEQLGMLPGVGPTKATRVLEWRTKNGKFARVDDLRKVKGFGRKTLLKLKPHLAVSGETTFKPKKKAPGKSKGAKTSFYSPAD